MITMKGLQRILRKRLPEIDRWKYVSVYSSEDKPDWVVSGPESIIIMWHGPKRSNIHPYEYKEIPKADIDIVADRNRMRIRNKTKIYR